MKRWFFACLMALVASLTLATTVFADDTQEHRSKPMMGQQPAESRAVGLHIELDRWDRDFVADGAVIPPFSHWIHFMAVPADEFGEFLFDEKIYWQLDYTTGVGDLLVVDYGSTWSILEVVNSHTLRTITLTAALYYNRDIYSTFSFTIDPLAPTIAAENAGEVVFTQGQATQALITVNTQNLPDGMHEASISWVPHGMYVAGWSEKIESVFDDGGFAYVPNRVIYGQIEIINGRGEFTLYTTEYFAGAASHYGFGLRLCGAWFAGVFNLTVLPVVYDIQFAFSRSRTEQFAGLPGMGYVEFWPILFCMDGEDRWGVLHQMIEWSAEGLAEGDIFPAERQGYGWKYLYVGSHPEARTITVTIAARDNPEVYAVATVYIDPDFVFTPTRIDLHFEQSFIAGINFISIEEALTGGLDRKIIHAFAGDDFNNGSNDLNLSEFDFHMDGMAPGDMLYFTPDWGVMHFVPDFSDRAVRLITITVTSLAKPDVYDYLYFKIVPSADYMPWMYIAGIEGRTITLHSENIPDGEHRIFMNLTHNQGWHNHLYLILWTHHITMEWEFDEYIPFVDGVGHITLNADYDYFDILDKKDYTLNFYWNAWIEEFGVMARGLGQIIIEDYMP
jgi:hypothetical protein